MDAVVNKYTEKVEALKAARRDSLEMILVGAQKISNDLCASEAEMESLRSQFNLVPRRDHATKCLRPEETKEIVAVWVTGDSIGRVGDPGESIQYLFVSGETTRRLPVIRNIARTLNKVMPAGDQCSGAGRARTENTVSRRDDAPAVLAAGIFTTPRRVGATPAAESHSLPRRIGAEREVARADCAERSSEGAQCTAIVRRGSSRVSTLSNELGTLTQTRIQERSRRLSRLWRRAQDHRGDHTAVRH